jgi:aryl-alcohol dehydrogenase-like predicted oxidoreductase
METIEIGTSGIRASRIALDTYAMGGWKWGGDTNDLLLSIHTVRSAIEGGITLVDTAPVYGFGLSERIVGTALSAGLRDRAIIATKGGVEWRDGKVRRNASPEHVRNEVDESLRRLRTDRIDLYQLHWPDPLVPIHETADTLARLLTAGKIRAIGVSNYSPDEMDDFRQAAPIHFVRSPYNLFDRAAEGAVFPYARRHNIAVLCYGTLCRGLLTGLLTPETQFKSDDLRRSDPKFQEPRFSRYLSAVASLHRYARSGHGVHVAALALRWVLDQGNTVALWGALHPRQLAPAKAALGWELDDMAKRYIDTVIRHTLKGPSSPESAVPASANTPALVA